MRPAGSIFRLSVLACVVGCGVAWGQPDSIGNLIPEGVSKVWVKRDAPQTFTRETLFEHINGQADLFLQYGFEQSVFATYQSNNNPDSVVSLDIYNMGDVLHAFGIFSRFRSEDRPGGIGLDSSIDDHDIFFYKGRYFVAMQATDANAQSLEQLAKAVDSKINDGSEPPKEVGYFPKDGLKPGSIEYFPQGLLGHEFLGSGFKATYIDEPGEKEQSELQRSGQDRCLFLAVFRDLQEAARSLELYYEDLSRRGAADMRESTQLGLKTLRGTDPYQGKVIVAQKGSHLIGAIGFEKERQGEKKLLELINKLPSGTK